MAGNRAEIRPPGLVDVAKVSERLRSLRAPLLRTASSPNVHFNEGHRLGQKTAEVFIGLVENLHVSGVENLALLRRMLKDNAGNPDYPGVMLAISHSSHLDMPTVAQAIEYGGGAELRKKMFIAIGDRLAVNPIADFVSRQYPWVRTPQPYDEAIDGPLTTDQREQKNKENLILLKDAKKAMEYLFNQGMYGIIAPTGTRRANHQPIPQVTSYFKGRIILPVSISGTDQILPPGEWHAHKGTAIVNFGEMFPFSEITDMFSSIQPRELQRVAQINEVMRRIDSLAPKNV